MAGEPRPLVDPFDAPGVVAPGASVGAVKSSNGDLVDPFDSPPEYVSEPEAGASVLDVGIASLADTPEARIPYYSRAMSKPESSFVVKGGNIFYKRPDGNFQAVAPTWRHKIAKGVGPSFPAVAGAAATILGAPFGGPVGMAAGGVSGAAAGQYARDALANQIMGQPFSAARPVREGAFDLAATVSGILIGKGISRVVATKAAKEVSRLIRSGGARGADAVQKALAKINQEYGVDIRLTPAEILNSPKLRAQQMALENTPQGAEGLADFYVGRGKQADKVFNQYVDRTISPMKNADSAGEGLSDAAGAALKKIGKQRMRAGSKVYQRAFDIADEAGGVDIMPVIRHLDEVAAKYPPARDGLAEIRATMAAFEPSAIEGRAGKLLPYDDLEHIQNTVKEALDDKISSALSSGNRKLAGRFQYVQRKLLSTLDEQSPLYKRAREIWGDLSKPITYAEGGILPSLNKATAKDFEYLGGRFFGRASPAEIGRARKLIVDAKGEGAWNDALGGFLRQRWEDAGRAVKSKIGREGMIGGARPASFWADMFGNAAQKARLRAGMTHRQYVGFNRLMKVFEATGRAANYNSTTAAQQVGLGMLDATNVVQKGLKVAANPNPLRQLDRLEGAYDTMLKNQNVETLLSVITSQESLKELAKAGGSAPGSTKAIVAAAKAINIAMAPLRSD